MYIDFVETIDFLFVSLFLLFFYFIENANI
jgi:hypothetical protein